MRLVINPGASFTTTTSLPIRAPISRQSATVSSDVSRPRTTSSNFIFGTGLKKCRPMHFSGRHVIVANSVIESDEVFDAKIELGRANLSSNVKISSFNSISSGTASMTTSAPRAASSTLCAEPSCATARSRCSAVTFPRATPSSSDVRMYASPASSSRLRHVLENCAVAAERSRVGDAASHGSRANHGDGFHFHDLLASDGCVTLALMAAIYLEIIARRCRTESFGAQVQQSAAP